MSNKFLNTASQSEMENTLLSVASISASNLDPGTTLKTDSTKRIVSVALGSSDIVGLDSTIGSLQGRSTALENKTQDLERIPGALECDIDIDLKSVRAIKRAKLMETDELSDHSGAAKIELTATNINVTANNLTFNNDDVLTTANAVITNPMIANLDGGGFELTNVQNIETGGVDLNQYITLATNKTIDLEAKTAEIAQAAGVTTVGGTLVANTILTNSILDSATSSELLNIDADSIDAFSTAFTFNGADVATYDELNLGTKPIHATTLTASGAGFQIQASNAGTVYSRQNCLAAGGVPSGQVMSSNILYANDDIGLNAIAETSFVATETHVAGAHGTKWLVSLTSQGSTLAKDRLVIDSDGVAYITGGLDVSLNSEAATRTEGGIAGELVKAVNTTNVYAGSSAGLGLTTASYSTFVGYECGATVNTQQNNTAVGYQAAAGVFSDNNTAFGANALNGLNGALLTGAQNTAIGRGALGNAQGTAQANTALGNLAGSALTTAVNCTIIGRNSQVPLVGTNCSVLGANITADANNQVMLGDNAVNQIVNAGDGSADIGSATHRFKDIHATGALSIGYINSMTPAGGQWLQISNATAVTGTNVEMELLAGASELGTLTVPANGFQRSAFHLNISGLFSSANGNTLTIRFKFGASVLTLPMSLVGASGECFELEVDFLIQATGGPGVAKIVSNVEFTHSDGGLSAYRGQRAILEDNTLFDTTIINNLQVTVQYSTDSPNNNIQALAGHLTRMY